MPPHGFSAFQMSLNSCFELYWFHIFHGQKALWLGAQEDCIELDQALVRIESLFFVGNGGVTSVKSQVVYSSYPYE